MRRIEAERQAVDLERFRGSYANERHVSTVVDEPCLVYLAGEETPSVAYLELDERLPEAVAALRSIDVRTNARSSGMLTPARTFGYAPKMPHRREEACRTASLARDQPEAHARIAGLSTLVEEHYRRLNADLYAQHVEAVTRVLPDWRLGNEGVFTSGIINRDSQLPYHYDRGNVADVWSNMLVFKRACSGGDLVCPELDLCFRLRDHSLFMFDGQGILHGVSPFRLSRRDGYRFSIVFYSLHKMWQCEPIADSLGLQQRRRTERERERFARRGA